MSDDRNLTDRDAEAIASELKKQIMQDFKVEVGAGVLVLVKKSLIWILLLLAIYGITHSGTFYASMVARQ